MSQPSGFAIAESLNHSALTCKKQDHLNLIKQNWSLLCKVVLIVPTNFSVTLKVDPSIGFVEVAGKKCQALN
jgi:hypothetical protein